jgi:biotin transporter BioY
MCMTKNKMSIKGMVYASLFGALTAAGAFMIIPLPFVPITGQTFFLNVAAILLGGTLAALSQIIYVLLGIVGIPVFAGGKAGIGVLFGPTGGYLLGHKSGLLLWHAWVQWFLAMIWLVMDNLPNLDGFINMLML